MQASSKQNSTASMLVGLTRPLFSWGKCKTIAKTTGHPLPEHTVSQEGDGAEQSSWHVYPVVFVPWVLQRLKMNLRHGRDSKRTLCFLVWAGAGNVNFDFRKKSINLRGILTKLLANFVGPKRCYNSSFPVCRCCYPTRKLNTCVCGDHEENQETLFAGLRCQMMGAFLCGIALGTANLSK